MEKSEVKKQWHGPFCSAVRLELIENKGDVDFQQEYQLSSKPLQIDLLVIKKTDDVSINNEIGKIFRGHNLMEYKSPGDALNIDTYFKVLGYACFYKSNGDTVDSIKDDDITISLVRETLPQKLIQYFRQRNYTIEKKYPGIYYVLRENFFPIQIIVSGELEEELHIWLASLTRNMTVSAAETLVYRIGDLSDKDDRMNASAILDLAINANPKIFDVVKEETPMFEELQKLMKPHIDAAVDAAVSEAVDAAVSEAVASTTEKNKIDSIEICRKKFNISLEEACQTFGMSVERYQEVKAQLAKKSETSQL